MPGMLSQAQEQPVPSSGPGPQTPPTESPGAGTPPLDDASGPGQPPSTAGSGELRDQAIQIIYGERFDKMVKMFQSNGPDKFARSMGLAVNTAITEIEKKNGPIGPEMAAKLGGEMFTMLLEDMLLRPNEGLGPVVEGVTGKELSEVIPAMLVMYADAHPDVSKEQIQQVMQEVSKQTGEQTGQPPTAAGEPPAAPMPAEPPQGGAPQGPPPTGAPMPPGAV
jgi:hypothetical protein